MSASLAKLADGWPVAPILEELDAHPELWGARPDRTAWAASPHRESLDIWLRFRPEAEVGDVRSYLDQHVSVWWPAVAALPSLRPVVFNLARMIEATEIGSCLLTRIPPACQVYPHEDHSWAAHHFNAKLYLILRANPECLNICGEDRAVMAPGEVWAFRNDLPHSVINGGETERIAAILTMRVEAWP